MIILFSEGFNHKQWGYIWSMSKLIHQHSIPGKCIYELNEKNPARLISHMYKFSGPIQRTYGNDFLKYIEIKRVVGL